MGEIFKLKLLRRIFREIDNYFVGVCFNIFVCNCLNESYLVK